MSLTLIADKMMAMKITLKFHILAVLCRRAGSKNTPTLRSVTFSVQLPLSVCLTWGRCQPRFPTAATKVAALVTYIVAHARQIWNKKLLDFFLLVTKRTTTRHTTQKRRRIETGARRAFYFHIVSFLFLSFLLKIYYFHFISIFLSLSCLTSIFFSFIRLFCYLSLSLLSSFLYLKIETGTK